MDVVEFALSQPIDWAQFERLVCEILADDDLPRLRRLGGVADDGQDAVEEAFYVAESSAVELCTVVQITSERAQTSKFSRTVKRLAAVNQKPGLLVVVYRQPVASPTRRQILAEAQTAGLTVDLRDEGYLKNHLAKPGNGIFARYFGDVRAQVDALLDSADPLEVATDRTHRAMLASLGAFVLHPRAHLARQTLFHQTVLAAIVACKSSPTLDQLRVPLKELLPEETLDDARLKAALAALEKEGHCSVREGTISVTPASAASMGTAISKASLAYSQLIGYVSGRVKRAHVPDQAARGYLERNIRRALVAILRSYGPAFSPTEPATDDVLTDRSIIASLARNLDPECGRQALLALHAFLIDEPNRPLVAQLARTYAALALRNVDPLGRRWQQANLQRSQIALDTDVILQILVEELPESKALRECLQAFVQRGTKIVVPNCVLAEAVGHVERAHKTYRRFLGRLHRMSPDMVDGHVWHAVVRGYYYAVRTARKPIVWETFFANYYDPSRPRDYIEHILRRRITFVLGDTEAIPDDWHSDLEEISQSVLEQKERTRPKAVFRDEDEMQRRIQQDVRIAMTMAVFTQSQESGRAARGYVVSDDGAFRRFESHQAWRQRPKVHVFTKALPELAEFVCGKVMDDEALVRVLFNPITSAAAEASADIIDACSSAGVDLSEVSIARLEWDMRSSFEARVHADGSEAEDDEDIAVLRAIRLAEAASAKGYTIESEMHRVLKRWDEVQAALSEEQRLRTQAVEDARQADAAREEAVAAAETDKRHAMKKVALAAIGQTRKGKRRVRRALAKLGLSLDELLGTDDVGGSVEADRKRD